MVALLDAYLSAKNVVPDWSARSVTLHLMLSRASATSRRGLRSKRVSL